MFRACILSPVHKVGVILAIQLVLHCKQPYKGLVRGRLLGTAKLGDILVRLRCVQGREDCSKW